MAMNQPQNSNGNQNQRRDFSARNFADDIDLCEDMDGAIAVALGIENIFLKSAVLRFTELILTGALPKTEQKNSIPLAMVRMALKGAAPRKQRILEAADKRRAQREAEQLAEQAHQQNDYTPGADENDTKDEPEFNLGENLRSKVGSKDDSEAKAG